MSIQYAIHEYDKHRIDELSTRYWFGESTTTDPRKILQNPCYEEIHFFKKKEIGNKFNKLHSHPFYGHWSTPHYYTFLFVVKFKRKRKHFGIKHFRNKPPCFVKKIKTNYLQDTPRKISAWGFECILASEREKERIKFVKASTN